MLAQELINIIEMFKRNHPEVEQISLYPNISQELLNEVFDKFPEFDISAETPLLFYRDRHSYASFDSTQKWVMLSDVRLYYYTYYLGESFNVLDYKGLHEINTFKMQHNKWTKDDYVQINDKKIGSLEIYNINEGKILSEFVNLVTDYVKVSGKVFKEDKPKETLENEELFSIARDYFDEVNRGGKIWGFETFYYGSFIPSEKLEEARQDYANYNIDNEKPIVYIDNSVDGRIGKIGMSGVVITNKYFYHKLMKSINDKKFTKGRIPLSDIKTFEVKCRFLSGWIVINSKRKFEVVRFEGLNKKEAKVFEALIQKFVQQLKETN